MTRLISIDIGSTYTKGALFELSQNNLAITGMADTRTTVNRLSEGFNSVLEKLRAACPAAENRKDEKIFFSSSAKGGLKVAAIGVVPALTLSSAKQAAYSAGAKITSVHAYKLCSSDINEIKKNCPDIILFTGGTDGGNETYNLHNARLLASGKPDCPIIYAGNRSAAGHVTETLASHDLHVVDNVLPELDTPNPGPAREKIRQIFLETITTGKGLDEIIQTASSEPYPTPYAMFEFLRKIYESEHDPLCAIDIGGATTDIYSCCPETVEPGVIAKGLPEPEVKRTVEGDLGLRVSAASAFESMRDFIEKELKTINRPLEAFADYLKTLVMPWDETQTTEPDPEFEKTLAKACFYGAFQRHAGKSEEVYTPQGKLTVQQGKDLRQIKKIIGAGGWLARTQDFKYMDCFPTSAGKTGSILLTPENFAYYIDKNHVLPLIANISFAYPVEAVKKGIESLQMVEVK